MAYPIYCNPLLHVHAFASTFLSEDRSYDGKQNDRPLSWLTAR